MAIPFIRQATFDSVGPTLDVCGNAKLMVSEIPTEGKSSPTYYNISVFLNSEWKQRRICFTKKEILFLPLNDNTVKDVVPLHEIEKVSECNHLGSMIHSDEEEDRQKVCGDIPYVDQRVIMLETIENGYNSGRTYSWKSEDCHDLERQILSLSETARKSHESIAAFKESQKRVADIFDSTACQTICSILIFANFVCNIIETQLQDLLAISDGISTPLGDVFGNLNLAFTIFFAVELTVNLYAHWLREFVNNRWNIVDSALVLWSLFAFENSEITAFRLVRVFRVVRIFGKFRSLRKIVAATSASVGPMVGAFVILMTLMCLYSILGVSLFGASTPSKFGAFDRAFITMFQLTAGDTWVETVELLGEDGNLNWSFAAFVLSYIMLSCWVLLQVTTAVLLDSFCQASNDIAMEENFMELRARRQLDKDPLGPLLLGLSVEYRDSEDLSERLQDLFQTLDTDHSGILTSKQLTMALRKLLEKDLAEAARHAAWHDYFRKAHRQRSFNPPLHFSKEDFDYFTLDGALCDANGRLDAASFEAAIRERLQRYAMNRLGLADAQCDQELALSQVFALKSVMMSLRCIERSSNRDLPSAARLLATVPSRIARLGAFSVGDHPNDPSSATISCTAKGAHEHLPAQMSPEPLAQGRSSIAFEAVAAAESSGHSGEAAESSGHSGEAQGCGDSGSGRRVAAPVGQPAWPSLVEVGNNAPVVVVTAEPNPTEVQAIEEEPNPTAVAAVAAAEVSAEIENATAELAEQPAALALSVPSSPVTSTDRADPADPAAFDNFSGILGGSAGNGNFLPLAVDATLPHLISTPVAADIPAVTTSAAVAALAPSALTTSLKCAMGAGGREQETNEIEGAAS